MNQLIQTLVFSIFALKNYSEYLSNQIIGLIIIAGYPRVRLSCGLYHTCLLVDYSTYASGYNNNGQLGLGHYRRQNLLQKINLQNTLMISCGDYHTLFLTKFGEVYACGANGCGQLGLGHNRDQNLPQKINLHNIIKIYCNSARSMALSKSNEIYAWGQNQNLPLIVKICPEFNLRQIIKFDIPNRPYAKYSNLHTIAITIFGEIYAWGRNDAGQLCLGHYQNNVNNPQKINF